MDGPVIRDPEDQMLGRAGDLQRYKTDWMVGLVKAQIDGGRRNRVAINRAKREIRQIEAVLATLTQR